jgi:hypothetical protein
VSRPYRQAHERYPTVLGVHRWVLRSCAIGVVVGWAAAQVLGRAM